VGLGKHIMAEVVTGATSTANISPGLRIPEMSWKIVSKKRKVRKHPKKI